MPTKNRLSYIDWMRGLACLLMFQTHCYDSWLSPEVRKSELLKWSQLGGTLPAPLFLFLAGVSFALVTDRMRKKGADANQVARQTILRGAEIFGLGLLFRIQEFALGYPWAPWTDLLRVDVLNMIGLSMIAMGVVCRLTAGSDAARATVRNAWAGVFTGLLIALVTPLLWTTWRPRFLPWPLESYINGVHTFNEPQPWLFPLFPWAAFAFLGLAAGFVLFSDWARAQGGKVFAGAAALGLVLILLARTLDASSVQLYPVYDFWHTSPNFFLIRIGILLLILAASYAWCRWGAADWGFSPLIQLGQTSLLVYWVHIEFVYGRFSILPKRGSSIGLATFGLTVIFVSMVLLSFVRTRFKGKLAFWKKRGPEPA